MNLKYLDSALRAKVTASTTPDEILAFVKEEWTTLSDIELGQISGGASGMLPPAPTTAPKTSWRASIPPSSVSAATGALFWKLGQAC